MNQVSIAIPTCNRFEMSTKAVEDVIDDPRVKEVVFNDDYSTDGAYEKLLAWAKKRHPKIKVFQNDENLDCYRNKAATLRRCKEDWCILFDSDNKMGEDYLNALYELRWDEDTAYLPTFARPHFDYRQFTGHTITRENVGHYMRKPPAVRGKFTCALNTANYLVNSTAYLETWDTTVNPHTADSIYMNYRLLYAGNSLHFVDGLEYDHLVHEGSHYKNNNHLTRGFDRIVETKLTDLK